MATTSTNTIMGDEEFRAFLSVNSSRKGIPMYNMNTGNVSAQARAILKDKYPLLAKPHINNAVIQAYKNNARFKSKLLEVLDACGVSFTPPAE